MDLKTYLLAIKRYSLPQCNGPDYLLPALADEVRELMEAQTAEDKVKEAGDCLYMTAKLREYYGLTTASPWYIIHDTDAKLDTSAFGIIAKAIRKQVRVDRFDLMLAFDRLDMGLSSLADESLSTIAIVNDAKLADRLKRGVIIGNGDNR